MKLVNCFRITALDGTIVRLTEFASDLTMSNSEVYLTSTNTAITSVSLKLDNGPAVIDFGAVYSASALDRDDVHSGKWDGASVRHFTTDWSNPVEDETPITLHTLGKIRERDGRYTAELLGLKDKLNTTIGSICTPLCQKIFTDSHLDNESIIARSNWTCGVDTASNTHAGIITSVINDYTFTSGALSNSPEFPDDYFGNGELLFKTGAANYGLGRRTVVAYTASTKTFQLDYPLYYTPQIGDTFDVLAGCRKRYTEDCVNKWSNGPNFGGFPHVPVASAIAQRGKK